MAAVSRLSLSPFLWKLELLCHSYLFCGGHISKFIFIHILLYICGCHVWRCFRWKEEQEKELLHLCWLLGVNVGVPVSDPYNGNGLSSGSLLTVTRQVIVANSRQERVKLKPVKNDTVLISELTVAKRLSGQVFSPHAFLQFPTVKQFSLLYVFPVALLTE